MRRASKYSSNEQCSSGSGPIPPRVLTHFAYSCVKDKFSNAMPERAGVVLLFLERSARLWVCRRASSWSLRRLCGREVRVKARSMWVRACSSRKASARSSRPPMHPQIRSDTSRSRQRSRPLCRRRDRPIHGIQPEKNPNKKKKTADGGGPTDTFSKAAVVAKPGDGGGPTNTLTMDEKIESVTARSMRKQL